MATNKQVMLYQLITEESFAIELRKKFLNKVAFATKAIYGGLATILTAVGLNKAIEEIQRNNTFAEIITDAKRPTPETVVGGIVQAIFGNGITDKNAINDDISNKQNIISSLQSQLDTHKELVGDIFSKAKQLPDLEVSRFINTTFQQQTDIIKEILSKAPPRVISPSQQLQPPYVLPNDFSGRAQIDISQLNDMLHNQGVPIKFFRPEEFQRFLDNPEEFYMARLSRQFDIEFPTMTDMSTKVADFGATGRLNTDLQSDLNSLENEIGALRGNLNMGPLSNGEDTFTNISVNSSDLQEYSTYGTTVVIVMVGALSAIGGYKLLKAYFGNKKVVKNIDIVQLQLAKKNIKEQIAEVRPGSKAYKKLKACLEMHGQGIKKTVNAMEQMQTEKGFDKNTDQYKQDFQKCLEQLKALL